MSSHGHDEHEHDDDAHAHDPSHDFDPEPTRTVPDDEPRTPAWVPATGASLFAIGLVAFFAMGDSKGAPAGAASASASARASATAPTLLRPQLPG